jgi:TPR repeat protein
MFRGLPAEISLSVGFRLKDSWAVSLRDLANLALVSPPNYEARFQVEVLLIKGRNTPADSRVMSVSLQRTRGAVPPAVASTPRQEPAPERILTAAPPEPQPEAKVEAAAPSFAPAQPKKMAISPETEAAMLDRATKMLSMGDVSSARLLFEHVAKKGSGKGAMALARTFDPAFFSSINTRGLKPDQNKAKEWYALAAELGQDEARSRLGALSTR